MRAHLLWPLRWNLFDFIVVAFSIPLMIGTDLGPVFGQLRMIRAFRVFRLFKRIKSLNKIISSLGNALPGIMNAALVQFLVMCIYAILGVDLFMDVGPESADYNRTGRHISERSDLLTERGLTYGDEYFGTFFKSLYTLFQVLTGDSWSSVVARPAVFSSDYGWRASIFFVSFVVICGIVLVNVAVAVLLEKMVDTDDEQDANGGANYEPSDGGAGGEGAAATAGRANGPGGGGGGAVAGYVLTLPPEAGGAAMAKAAAAEAAASSDMLLGVAREHSAELSELRAAMRSMQEQSAQREVQLLEAIEGLSAKLDEMQKRSALASRRPKQILRGAAGATVATLAACNGGGAGGHGADAGGDGSPSCAGRSKGAAGGDDGRSNGAAAGAEDVEQDGERLLSKGHAGRLIRSNTSSSISGVSGASSMGHPARVGGGAGGGGPRSCVEA